MKVIDEIVVKDNIRWLVFDENPWKVIKDSQIKFDGIVYEANPVYGARNSITIKTDITMLNKIPEK